MRLSEIKIGEFCTVQGEVVKKITPYSYISCENPAYGEIYTGPEIEVGAVAVSGLVQAGKVESPLMVAEIPVAEVDTGEALDRLDQKCAELEAEFDKLRGVHILLDATTDGPMTASEYRFVIANALVLLESIYGPLPYRKAEQATQKKATKKATKKASRPAASKAVKKVAKRSTRR
jgi:hypothetical protein